MTRSAGTHSEQLVSRPGHATDLTVLIVDDLAINLKLLHATLEAEGATVLQALNGVEALKVLEHTAVDGIVCDILMPKMDGYQLCNKIRSDPQLEFIPFIFYTATYTSPADQKFALELGADMFFHKPVSAEEILKSIRAIKARPRERRGRTFSFTREEVLREYSDRLVSTVEQKNVELEKLADELRKLSIAVEQTADNIIITDREGVIQYVNPAFELFTGYAQSEILGKTPRVLQSGKHSASFHAWMWKTITSGKTFRDIFINKKKDGELFYSEQTITPLVDPAGRVTHFVSSGRDVTERIKAEEKANRLAAIVQSSDDAIVGTSLEDVITSWNKGAEKTFGYAEAEIVGRGYAILVPPGREDEEREHLERIRRGESLEHYETVRRRKDGTDLFMSLTMSPIYDNERKVAGASTIGRDVTDRKLAEEKLLQSEEQFRLIAENVADMITVLDLNGTRMYNSPSYKSILGDPESLRGTDGFREVHPEDTERVRRAFVETIRTGIGQRMEYRMVRADESVCSIDSKGSVIRDSEGRVSQVVMVSRDVTEEKRRTAEMLRTQRMESIGTLAGGVAHDLNNVLAPIMMAIEVLRTRIPDPGGQKILGVLETSARRGSDIVKQVLAFGRGVEGEHILVQLRHVIKEVVNIASETFPKSIEITTELPKELWTVLADPTQMLQVILNLLVNARDAMPEGGTLSITAENVTLDRKYVLLHPDAKPGAYVSIAVADTGTGIPPEMREKIFEPFFTTKEIGKGTGLGLSTTLGIVRSHEGFIKLYSEVGRGTAFRIYLPAAGTASSVAAPGEAIQFPMGHGELILIIDDEAAIREITRETLQAYGYTTMSANDGAEGIAVFAEHWKEIKVVITDMMMPVMDGTAATLGLKKIDPNVKIIAASGLAPSGPSDPQSGSQVQAFLAKPYTAEKLLKTLSALLENAPP